ncbi:MAG: hypothetical protein Q7R40_15370, partial [Phaeospirillum sp.]|nr:hypothetical protein [Phaeospirillum sp.]
EREAAEDKAKTDGVINAWTGDLKRIADALDTRRRYKLARAASPVMGTISLPPRGLRRGGNTMTLAIFIKRCLECPNEKALHEWFDNVFPEHV